MSKDNITVVVPFDQEELKDEVVAFFTERRFEPTVTETKTQKQFLLVFKPTPDERAE